MPFTVEDRLDIHELLARHGHLVDQGRLSDADLAGVFVPEVRYDATDLGGTVLVGLREIREAGLTLGERNPVAHLVTNVVVTPDETGDRATALSKGLGVTTAGGVGSVTYDDVIVRTPTGWRIAERRIAPRRVPLQP